MPATLRPCAPKDFEVLHAIDQACYPPGIAYTKHTLRWFLRRPCADCIVAEVGSRIAGFVLAEREGREAHVITIDVLAEHRRHGVGTALIAAIETRLAAHDVRRIELETATDNTPAVVFWRKHGYRTVAVLKGYYLNRFDAYLMQKLLRPREET